MRALRLSGFLSALGLLLVAAPSHDARGAWPPAPDANMKDPANWPNDPSYKGLWQFNSWLPPQAPGASPYLTEDVALGASGMSFDRVWPVSIGRPDVLIT